MSSGLRSCVNTEMTAPDSRPTSTEPERQERRGGVEVAAGARQRCSGMETWNGMGWNGNMEWNGAASSLAHHENTP